MKDRDELLRSSRRRSAVLGETSREAGSSVLTDLTELDVRAGQGLERDAKLRVDQTRTKLQQARETIQEVPKELGALTAGIEEELLRIGYKVEEARSFTAWERFLLFIGQRDKAEVSRLKRLEDQSVDESIRQITKLVLRTIEELGDIEKDYERAVGNYSADANLALQKLKEAQPKFEEATALREKYAAAIETLKLELESGTVDASARPQKEQELEILQKQYQQTHLRETDLLIIIKIANEAIRELQKNRDAAQETITSIHGMRRQLLEKQEGFSSILNNALTGVKSAARIERFNTIDPALNKTITVITDMNVKVAAGAMETLAARLEKAAIDPERSLQLAQELAENTREFLEKLEAIAAKAEEGRGGVSSSSGDDDSSLQDLGTQP